MVEDHIHYDFNAPVVSFVYQRAIFFVGTETWVYFVIIGRGIAVVRTAFHIVLKYRGEPGAVTPRSVK